MDGREFLVFAAQTAAGKSTPAALRSAVSRAYYGAFHIARDYLEQHGFRCRRDDHAHKFVVRHFHACEDSLAKEIGKMLNLLHEERKLADYDLANSKFENPVQARVCVERAHSLAAQIDSCREPAVAARVLAEMTAYRKSLNII